MSTEIAWTDETWNPTVGCSRVSAGCENCYAERVAHRNLIGEHEGLTKMTSRGPTWTGEVRLLDHRLEIPLHWRKPRRIFVDSMSDLFHEHVPDLFIDRVLATTVLAPQHTYQILTKRPARMRAYFDEFRFAMIEGVAQKMYAERTGEDPSEWLAVHELPNVWLGTSAENQETLDERVPHLLKTPAAVRFLSLEPLLGPVDLSENVYPRDGVTWDGAPGAERDPRIDWIITGGESGHGARPCNVEWIRSIVEQCREAQVPCFVKQLGAKPRGWCSSLLIRGAIGHDNPDFCDVFESGEGGGCGDRCLYLKQRKCNDPDEWPEDLRVREFPT